eukprot:1157065-Pelagomonas_calceolata.AAC.18
MHSGKAPYQASKQGFHQRQYSTGIAVFEATAALTDSMLRQVREIKTITAPGMMSIGRPSNGLHALENMPAPLGLWGWEGHKGVTTRLAGQSAQLLHWLDGWHASHEWIDLAAVAIGTQ